MSTLAAERPFLLDEAFSCDQALLTSPGQFHCWPRPDGTLRVERADPVVWCTRELLAILHAGEQHPQVSFECARQSSAIGDIIRVEADGQRYIYVITRKVTAHDAIWEARWPD